MKKKRVISRSFLKQVMTLSLSACIVSTVLLGLGQSLLSGRYFSKQAENDIEFYMEKTNMEFDTHVKNMENMIIAFRNNSIIRGFLEGNESDSKRVNEEFKIVTDLYSESNMVDNVKPFVGSVYLFSKNGRWLSNQVYPQTLEEQNITELTFREINHNFQKYNREYKYIPTEKRSFICTHVYNSRMDIVGTCIITIEMEAVQGLFDGTQRYPEQLWAVTGAENELLFSNPRGNECFEDIKRIKDDSYDILKIGYSNYMVNMKQTGFGLKSRMLVGEHNIYRTSFAMLMPFAIMFIFVISIAAIVVFLISLRITKPIKQMGEDIKRFSEGSGSEQMREFGVTEFDEVSHLYNKMTREIKDLVAQVYEKQLLASQAQVKYLQSQINPHFMFNILSMMGMRAALNGDTETQKLLSAFAKLMQGKIFRRGESLIPLKQELEIVKFYLLLQSERFAGKIDYEIKCGNEILEAQIPRLLIEPMVENAVAHGLEPKDGPGKVIVTAKRENDNLCIQIQDNGVGFSLDELADKEQIMADEKHTHIGIEITRQMLKTLYKDKATMDVQSAIGEGTTVTITMPYEGGSHNVEGHDCG